MGEGLKSVVLPVIRSENQIKLRNRFQQDQFQRGLMATAQLQNYIAGEWIAGTTISKDVNPSDTGDVIAEYAQADKAQTKPAGEVRRPALPPGATVGVPGRADLPDTDTNGRSART